MPPRPFTPPPGWAREGNNYIRANFRPIPGKNWFQYSVDPVNGNRIVYAIGPQISTGLTNQVTGQSFDIGGSRREVMSIDANGNVTKLKYYDEASTALGASGLERVKNSSREAATKAISQTNVATPETKESKEFKAPLENTKKQEEATEISSSTSQDELLSNKSIQSSEKNKNAAPLPGAGGASPLSYPLNRDPNQDYIKFLMYEFSPKKFLASGGNAELGARLADRSDTKNIVGSVTLPIQPTISDSNIVNWNEDVLDAATQVFGKISLGAILGGPSGAETETKNQVNNMDPEGTKALVAGSLANAATGTNKNLFTRTTGAIVNPNAELLFQGPGLRSFTFTFTLSAREEKEAVAIRSIIRFFKQGMAAKRAESTLFLKSPNTFGIKYMYGSGEHPWINKIKECALQNFSVNYTPAGNYATYSDGAMTSYELTMSFTELDPIYFDEYKSPNEIGY